MPQFHQRLRTTSQIRRHRQILNPLCLNLWHLKRPHLNLQNCVRDQLTELISSLTLHTVNVQTEAPDVSTDSLTDSTEAPGIHLDRVAFSYYLSLFRSAPR